MFTSLSIRNYFIKVFLFFELQLLYKDLYKELNK